MLINDRLRVKFESRMSSQIYQVHADHDAKQMLNFDEAENFFKYAPSIEAKQREWNVTSW